METMMLRRTFIAGSLGTVASALTACKPGAIERSGDLYTGAALAFGTVVKVSLFHADGGVAERAIEDAFAAAHLVDQTMSIYSEGSQVYQLNLHGRLERPSAHLLTVLRSAADLSVLTKGAFDITVQPLWGVYQQAARSNARPTRTDRLKASAKLGWERVLVEDDRVTLCKPGMQVTLNGLAQGYAADLALEALRARGIAHALVDMGEFSARGAKSSQQPWTLGVPDPRDPGLLAARLRLEGRSVATSGDYATAFTPDFVHHHIFDPSTGESPQELASVTVVAPTGLQADGLSTACMVMGARKAHALAARLPGVDVMTINKRGVVWKSPSFPSLA
jgi:thiamine biosynthesis lipoprotein